MVTIVVGHQTQKITGIEGIEATVRVAVAKENGETDSIHSIEEFSDLSEVKILLSEPGTLRDTKISEALSKAIAEYFARYHSKVVKSFDCYAFVCVYADFQSEPIPYFDRFWETKPLDWWPHCGDIVFLTNDSPKEFRHAAVCIAPDLYVSVWGGGGVLEFASLSEMKRFFCAEYVSFATPRADVAP